jgi:hypothetical protein
MTDTLEIRPMAHPKNKWGVFNVAQGKFVVSYPDRESAYAWAFGYLNEHIRNLKVDAKLLKNHLQNTR